MENYIVYDAFNHKYPSKPFAAAKILLKQLYLANQATEYIEKHSPYFEDFILKREEFAINIAPLLARAGRNGEEIIALHNDSYIALTGSKRYILENQSVKDKVELMLGKMGLTTNFLADTVLINSLLLRESTLEFLKQKIALYFSQFRAAVYFGPNIEILPRTQNAVDNFCDTIKLKRVKFERECKPSGVEILNYAPDTAFQMAAAVLLEACDNGADFIIVSSTRSFYMFDTMRKNVEKAAGRKIPIYVLTLNQVAMLAIGIINKRILGFDAHKVKPTIIK